MKDRGVVEGYSDGSFRPGNTINRAEFLKIILEGRSNSIAFSGSNCFPDVGNEWFAKYVCTAKNEGIIGGYPDGTFQPGREINFVEASKIVALAFGQEAQEHGSQWYEGYVKALESSKAIPPTIDGLERRINRGEMVEMMWRLADNRTDQPSKGYLNVKHPELAVDLSAEVAQTAESCADIQAFAEEAAPQHGGGFMKNIAMPMMMEMEEAGMDGGMADDMAMESVAAPQASRAKADYSETNVQVQGVDEADIVKTDGTYLYIVRNQNVTILRAQPASDMKVVGTIYLEDSTFNAQELYIDDGKLIVLGSVWNKSGPYGQVEKRAEVASMIAPDYYPYYGNSKTQVRVYDVSNPSNPDLTRKVTFDGSKVSSRRIGDKMYLVLNQNINWWGGPVPLGAAEDELLPKFQDSARGDVEEPVTRCKDVVILPRVKQPQYLIVAVIPTDNTAVDVKREAVVGNGQNVYMSLKNLYVANTNWNYTWRAGASSSTEKTNVYRFAITDTGLQMKSEGSVPGRILNQFSMDEHSDYFRIATTKGQVWDENQLSGNNLYIMNLDLDTVGSVEDIAPGESIKSVRYMGNRAYMVTFKQVDPLFVIDTSNPRNPKILGKLKIPGWSDYLHPYDENHLLGFGKEVDETIDADKVHSANAIYYTAVLGMKLAIFDVSDVKNPKEIHKEVIGDRGTESPLLQNHKALLFDKERGLLAFPINVMEFQDGKSVKDEGAYPVQTFQGAYVYDVDLRNGFDLQGRISHYSEQDLLKAGSYFYGKNIDRILRIGDSLLTIGQSGVQSHSAKTIKKEGGVEFSDGGGTGGGEWWWEE